MENKKLDSTSLVSIGGKEYEASNFSLVPSKSETEIVPYKYEIGNVCTKAGADSFDNHTAQGIFQNKPTNSYKKAPALSNKKAKFNTGILREVKRATKKTLEKYDSSGNDTLKISIDAATGAAKAYKTIDNSINAIKDTNKTIEKLKRPYIQTTVETQYNLRINESIDKKVTVSSNGDIQEFTVSSTKERILSQNINAETIKRIKKARDQAKTYEYRNSFSYNKVEKSLDVEIHGRDSIHRASGTIVDEEFTDNITNISQTFHDQTYSETEEFLLTNNEEEYLLEDNTDGLLLEDFSNPNTQLDTFGPHQDDNYMIKTEITKSQSIDIEENLKYNTTIVYKFDRNSIKTAIGKGIGKSIKTGLKAGVRTSVNATENAFESAEDLGCQTIALGVKGTKYTFKAANAAPKVLNASYNTVKTVGKTGIKTGKVGVNAVKTGANFVKLANNVGIKKASKIAIKTAASNGKIALANAGKSTLNFIGNLIKKVGRKIIPLLIILLLLLSITSGVSSFLSVVGGTLTPFFGSTDSGEIDETSWLTTKITAKRTSLLNSVKATYNHNIITHGGSYHFVRFYNAFSDAELELTDVNIYSSMYSVNEYLEYIQPIFHTLILTEYEMNPSSHQMTLTFNDIWNNLSSVKTEILPTEYCYMTKTDNADGSYTITPVTENDLKVHAKYTCPNPSATLYHADNLSEALCTCDYYYYSCNGHEGSCAHSCSNDCAGGCTHSHNLNCYLHGCSHVCDSGCAKYCGHSHSTWYSASNPGCHYTNYCGDHRLTACSNSTKHKYCNGYKECKGHKVLSLSIDLGNFDKLLKKYFTNEIADLEALATLDAAQTERLKTLRENYKLCLDYLKVLEDGFGRGGGVVVDLNGVSLTAVTSFACSFVGNPYVWGGTDPNVGADCSGFVKYVYANFGATLPRVSSDQVTVGSLVPDITSAQPGDLIFWSDDGTDSGVYHVAMYLGNGKLVHASNGKPYPQGGIKISNVYGTIYKIKRIAHS